VTANPANQSAGAKVGSSLINVRRAFGEVWQAHSGAAMAMVACTAVAAFIPATQAWVGKLIVDGVVSAARSGAGAEAGLRAVMPYLLAELGLVVLQAAISQGRRLAEHILHAYINLTLSQRLIRKALSLDLTYFENAEYYDKLENARREADYRSLRIVNGGFYVIQNTVTLISYAVLLIRFSPLLAVILFAATIPAFIAQNKFAELSFRVLSRRAPESRTLGYLEQLLTDYHVAKEIKLFGLGEPLLDRYGTLFWKFLREDQDIATRRSWASLVWGLLATLSYYGSYAWIVWRAVGSTITLGDMTMYLGIFRHSQSTFSSIFDNLNQIYENSLFLNNLFAFLELKPKMAAPEQPAPMPLHFRDGLEFRNVSFRYEGASNWALRDVNLRIKPGEKIALVGPNGAGKTTLIKLLTRMYDPTEGQILLDGVDLRNYDPADVYRRFGVIFQDFVRYQFTAGDNIGFGQVDALDDHERIVTAADRGGAIPLIESMPDSYDTMLGRRWEKGLELSGGQWQKIALARAFMRKAEVLVLDEPTSALDAEAEYDVFRRFGELMHGRIAVLISHRFSTVRMADRIAVLSGGNLIELGSHAELMALDGAYARLFNLQAQGYR